MKTRSAVPVIVVTKSEEQAEAINRHLRNAGHAVHCRWVVDAIALQKKLPDPQVQLIVVFADETSLEIVHRIRQESAQDVAILAVYRKLTESTIEKALKNGAADALSLKHVTRLQLVVTRELRALRFRRASTAALTAAKDYRKQLHDFVDGSPDAILHCQEGIIVSANPAWCELLGHKSADKLTGLPLMDIFQRESHTSLKGALMACHKGSWSGHTIRAKAITRSGKPINVELELEKAEYDSEPCICVRQASSGEEAQQLQAQLADALSKDPVTGMFHRRYFLKRMREHLATKPKGGICALAYIKPDQFRRVRDQVGPIDSDDVLLQLAGLIQDAAEKIDVYGRFGGLMFTNLMPRGTLRDVEAWAEQLRMTISNHVFQAAEKSISITCTIGIAVYEPGVDNDVSFIEAAQQACLQGRKNGGNRVVVRTEEQDTIEIQIEDIAWSERIKLALMKNQFRLLKLPIVSLQGHGARMYDILIRMIDDNNNEILPSKFMRAAEKSDLAKHVDRWVLAEAIRACSEDRSLHLFGRLSADSLCDDSLADWLSKQFKAQKADPGQLILQIPDKTAEKYINETKRLSMELKRIGCGFAVEHFGVGDRPQQLLDHVPMDFLKVDGSLMQGIMSNEILQMKVKDYIQRAKAKNIKTIGERVENANTMAVLFQLGAEYVQGHYVQEPEVTMQETQGANKLA